MAAPSREQGELARGVLVVLFILGLLAGSLWVLRPFLTALICATTIAIATWPMLMRVQRWLGGNRGAAAACLLAAMTLAFLIPVYFGVVAAVQGMSRLASWAHDLSQQKVPVLPDWIVGIPNVGPQLQEQWADLAGPGGEGLRARLSEHASVIVTWMMGRLGNLVALLAQVVVTLVITGLLYARGDQLASGVQRFSRRLAGTNGEQAVRLAALATRGVALGVVLTPLIQSILAAIGMAVAGVSHVGLFAILVLVTCLSQGGPIPALLVPVAFLFARDAMVPAFALAGWAVVVHFSGVVLRPLLIRRGADLPLTVILSGVIGGVAAFGAIGLFIGPVLLAVTATLLRSWTAGGVDAAVEATGARPAASAP